jgi:hypothetical protein
MELIEESLPLESYNTNELIVEDPPNVTKSKGTRTKTFQMSKKTRLFTKRNSE